LDQNSL